MNVFPDCYIEEFNGDIVSEFIILLNEVEEHNKQKYLLIVAQDINTHKTVKLIDTHGVNVELCKYCDNWAQLKKGDVIKVKCVFYNAKYSANVLRIKSNYELIKSVDFYQEIKNISITDDTQSKNALIKFFQYDEFSKPSSHVHKGKYIFVFGKLSDALLVEYKTKDNKKKYQFYTEPFFAPAVYADIISSEKEIINKVGKYYSGFALKQIGFKNGKVIMKVYDFLNNSENFTDEVINSLTDDDLPF